MTPEEAFLEDIRENPDDDAPRLIFADWLQEHGGPSDEDRAEFIRVQCQRFALEAGDPQEQKLRQRAEELLRNRWHEWVRPLGQLLSGSQRSETWLRGEYHPEALYKFRRGFIWVLDVNAAHFLEHASEILRLAPVEQLRIFRAGGLGNKLAECGELRFIRRIDFPDYWHAPVDAFDMRALANSPYLSRLRALSLYRNNLGDSGLQALAEAPWLGGIDTLELGENGLSAQGIYALSETSQPFRPLRLRLGANPIGNDGVHALVSSPVVSKLRSLALDGCRVGPPGVAAILRSPYLTALQWLDLEGNELGETGRQMLERLRARQQVSVRSTVTFLAGDIFSFGPGTG